MIAIVQHLFLQRVPRSSSRSTFICFTHQVHQHENVIFQLTFWYYEEVTFPKDRFPRVLSRCFPDFLAVWKGEHLSRRVGFVAELVGIVFVLIRRALTKNATETYFVELNFYEKIFAACKDAYSQASLSPVYPKDPREPWGWMGMRSPVQHPGISSLQSSWSLCQFADCSLVVMRNVRAVFERTKWPWSTAV